MMRASPVASRLTQPVGWCPGNATASLPCGAATSYAAAARADRCCCCALSLCPPTLTSPASPASPASSASPKAMTASPASPASSASPGVMKKMEREGVREGQKKIEKSQAGGRARVVSRRPPSHAPPAATTPLCRLHSRPDQVGHETKVRPGGSPLARSARDWGWARGSRDRRECPGPFSASSSFPLCAYALISHHRPGRRSASQR